MQKQPSRVYPFESQYMALTHAARRFLYFHILHIRYINVHMHYMRYESVYKESRIPQRSFLLMMIYRRATGHSNSNFIFKKSLYQYYDHFHAS